MSELQSQLRHVFSQVRVVDPQSFTTLDGRLVRTDPRWWNGSAVIGRSWRDPLIACLRDYLYASVYIRPRTPVRLATQQGDDAAFRARLLAHAPAGVKMDRGWRVLGHTDSRLWVSKGSRQRQVGPGEWSPSWENAEQGSRFVDLKIAPLERQPQPDFFLVRGYHLADYRDETTMIRFYFNIKPEFAGHLLGDLCARFNRFQIPFAFKTLIAAEQYYRADAAVLYLPARFGHISERLVAQIFERLSDGLESALPLFTRAVFPGIGFAQDPGTGPSFGIHRCDLLARVLVEAYQKGKLGLEALMQAYHNIFSGAGVDPESPWQALGSPSENHDFAGVS